MQNATSCAVPAVETAYKYGRAGCSYKLHARFGEGWLEKGHGCATSLASYSTVRPVRGGADRKGPATAPRWPPTLEGYSY